MWEAAFLPVGAAHCTGDEMNVTAVICHSYPREQTPDLHDDLAEGGNPHQDIFCIVA